MRDKFEFDASTSHYRPANAYWLGRLADLAYEKSDVVEATVKAWGLPNVRFVDHNSTQLVVAGDDKVVLVAFRGTEPKQLKDWHVNVDAEFDPSPFGRVHRGFQRALRFVWDDLCNAIVALQTSGQALFFTGHSLGAALATIAVAHLRGAPNDKPVYGLYTFGSPRVGDRDFEQQFNNDFGSQCFRFVNNNDLVTRLPPRSVGFSHVGQLLYFDRKGGLSIDPAKWFKFLDSVRGSAVDLTKLGVDALKDHSMTDGYLPHLERNYTENPFDK